MKKTFLFMALVLTSILGALPILAEERSVTAPGAEVVKLAGDFKFTEGPAVDAEGNVFFTDQPNDRILNGVLTVNYPRSCNRAGVRTVSILTKRET